jgi:hypothetical protein
MQDNAKFLCAGFLLIEVGKPWFLKTGPLEDEGNPPQYLINLTSKPH